MVDDLHIPAIVSYLVCGHVICDLTHYHVLSLAPLIFHLSLALEHIQFHEDYYELYSPSCSVIIPFLPVCFAVGLQVHFSISLFEALYFFNTSWDMARVHMSTPRWKIEIDWEMRVPPKHQIMWRVTCHRRSCTVIHLTQFRQDCTFLSNVSLPIILKSV